MTHAHATPYSKGRVMKHKHYVCHIFFQKQNKLQNHPLKTLRGKQPFIRRALREGIVA